MAGMRRLAAFLWALEAVAGVRAGAPGACRMGVVGVAPRADTGLTFCQQFRRRTCCNRTHTNRLRRRLMPYLVSGELPEACLQGASRVLCAECEPAVGAGESVGVCEHVCQSWFEACAGSMFTLSSVQDRLEPCAPDSLLCYPLGEAVRDGRDFCARVGVAVSPSGGDTVGQCYDGKMAEKYRRQVQKELGAEHRAAAARWPSWGNTLMVTFIAIVLGTLLLLIARGVR